MSRRPFRPALRGKGLTSLLTLVLGMAIALPCSHSERRHTPFHAPGHGPRLLEPAQPASFDLARPPAANRPLSHQQRWVF